MATQLPFDEQSGRQSGKVVRFGAPRDMDKQASGILLHAVQTCSHLAFQGKSAHQSECRASAAGYFDGLVKQLKADGVRAPSYGKNAVPAFMTLLAAYHIAARMVLDYCKNDLNMGDKVFDILYIPPKGGLQAATTPVQDYFALEENVTNAFFSRVIGRDHQETMRAMLDSIEALRQNEATGTTEAADALMAAIREANGGVDLVRVDEAPVDGHDGPG